MIQTLLLMVDHFLLWFHCCSYWFWRHTCCFAVLFVLFCPVYMSPAPMRYKFRLLSPLLSIWVESNRGIRSAAHTLGCCFQLHTGMSNSSYLSSWRAKVLDYAKDVYLREVFNGSRMTEENQKLWSSNGSGASRSPTSSWLVLLVFSAQTVPTLAEVKKPWGSRISDTFDRRKQAKPWNIFQLTPHPRFSADRSARKGKSPGTQTFSSCRDQPSPKETFTAYLSFRKQTELTVEKYGQRTKRTLGTASLHQTCSVLTAYDLESLRFFWNCAYYRARIWLGTPIHCPLLAIRNVVLQKSRRLKAAWWEGMFTVLPGSPLCNNHFLNHWVLTTVSLSLKGKL